MVFFSANNAEIIVSGGMTMPQIISPLERITQQNEKIPLNRIKWFHQTRDIPGKIMAFSLYAEMYQATKSSQSAGTMRLGCS